MPGRWQVQRSKRTQTRNGKSLLSYALQILLLNYYSTLTTKFGRDELYLPEQASSRIAARYSCEAAPVMWTIVVRILCQRMAIEQGKLRNNDSFSSAFKTVYNCSIVDNHLITSTIPYFL